MNSYCDFKDREICFFDSEKKWFPIRGYKADTEEQLNEIPKFERDLRNRNYNSYCSICQYDPMPFFNPWDNAGKNKAFKQWVEVRDLTIKDIDFFIDFDGTDLKTTFTDALNAREHLKHLIGDQALLLNIYFSGNKGFHLLGKMGASFGSSPEQKLRKNYELAMMLKPLCQTIDETIYDLARVRKILGSKVYSPNFGVTRVISCDTLHDFEELEILLSCKDWVKWSNSVVKELNLIERIGLSGLIVLLKS